MKNNNKERVKFLVEVPPHLASNLRHEAEQENRSRNAQINQILKERYAFLLAASNQAEPFDDSVKPKTA